jgi:hypothetical protein
MTRPERFSTMVRRALTDVAQAARLAVRCELDDVDIDAELAAVLDELVAAIGEDCKLAADAKHLFARLRWDGERLVLSIAFDGRVAATRSAALRPTLLGWGGRLDIVSGAHVGTRLHLTVPCRDERLAQAA